MTKNLDRAMNVARDYRREAQQAKQDEMIDAIVGLVGTRDSGLDAWTVPSPVASAMGLTGGVIRRVPRDATTGSPWEVR